MITSPKPGTTFCSSVHGENFLLYRKLIQTHTSGSDTYDRGISLSRGLHHQMHKRSETICQCGRLPLFSCRGRISDDCTGRVALNDKEKDHTVCRKLLDEHQFAGRLFLFNHSLQNRLNRKSRLRATSTSNIMSVTPDDLWSILEPKLKYLSRDQQLVVKEALNVAYFAHSKQFRKSGEPFIIHPVAVCGILADLKMDTDTLVAGLLHDTVEDTESVTFDRIEDQFGIVVRKIVEGETKVSKIGKVSRSSGEVNDRAEIKADDLRQMFLAMTSEIRVIIVKLADRLHNMRTLQHMSESKQKLISVETLEVFAPLAKLLGMYCIKEELEELSLLYMDKEACQKIRRRIDELSVQQEHVIVGAKEQLQQSFSKDPFLLLRTKNIKVECLNRPIYSIYKEALEKGMPFEDIRDVAILRINLEIDDTIQNSSFYGTPNQVCYHVLGMVHAMWTPLPERVKDFIAMPKPNGYRSIHTTVLPRELRHGSLYPVLPLRLHIRTSEMHRVAEYGITAEDAIMSSWKEESEIRHSMNLDANTAHTDGRSSIAKKMAWLNAIQEWQDEFVGNMTATEFVDTVTGDILGSKLFVFSTKGEIVNLPKGATIIDYAYQIDSDVGNKMVAAKVDGKLRPPEYRLRNGEIVEIIKYEGGEKPSRVQVQHHRDWLSFAKTRSAIHKITKYLQEHEDLLEGDEDFAKYELDEDVYIDDVQYCSSGSNGANSALEEMLYQEEMTQVSLVIQCHDRDGLLSDVSGVISENGLSIRSYSGSYDAESNTFYMNYDVMGKASFINKVGNALREVQGVQSYNVGWTLDIPKKENEK